MRADTHVLAGLLARGEGGASLGFKSNSIPG